MPRLAAALAALAALTGCGLVAGCGYDVQLPDLFLLTRTGQGSKLTLLVNDGGTVRCDGGKARMLSSSMLISARDLSDDLVNDATAKLTIPAPAGSVFYFHITMQQGTIAFPDRAAGRRKELAEAELFATQTAQRVCGLSG
jgi:hypothetical protein